VSVDVLIVVDVVDVVWVVDVVVTGGPTMIVSVVLVPVTVAVVEVGMVLDVVTPVVCDCVVVVPPAPLPDG